MMKYLFTTLTICLLISCSTKNTTIKHAHLQLKSPQSWYNLYDFQENGLKYYYTYELLTGKKIIIYDEKGKLQNEIELTKFMEQNACELSAVFIESNKQFILLSKNNHIFIVDADLKIKKEFSFSNFHYKGLHFNPPLFVSKNEIITAVSATWPDGKKFDSDYSSNAHLHKQPKFVKINRTTGRVKTTGRDLIRRYLKPLNLDLQSVFYTCAKDSEIIYNSAFTDTIYHISRAGKTTSITRVESKIGTIISPAFLSKEIRKNPDMIRNTYVSNSWIYKVLIDDFQKLNYVIVRRPLEQFEDFPFNVLIYDENWEKLDELEFKGDTYRLNFLVTKDGLLMERANNNSEKRVFDCLEYTN
ncbi:hypothetical protein [Fluviicola taffensis]|uniref:Lipoprotein n=1 Tax=Fluviicola taffensis (strain DSM 16823 / NCIMB 13979 / RW262) TaxID=755732 RepID=F2IAR1_FLUTR|nr:hypothetical protein [Fluviicola taffensis]AEA44216.1 hypothetical protein Fluta_2230 [Fluviicola taffensis DSM 16823]